MYSQLGFEISESARRTRSLCFISGSQYGYPLQSELGIGIERGIATQIDGAETVIGFKDVNFGDYGSDEISIPIFSPDQRNFQSRFGKGYPVNRIVNCLNTVIYTKGST